MTGLGTGCILHSNFLQEIASKQGIKGDKYTCTEKHKEVLMKNWYYEEGIAALTVTPKLSSEKYYSTLFPSSTV